MSKRPVRTVVSEDSLKLIGIPKSFRGNTLKDFDVKGKSELKKVKGLVQAYIEDLDSNFENNKGLFLYGSNGVGKTMLSSIILKEAYRHRYTSRRSTFVEYVDKYTKVWNAKSADEKATLEDELYTYYKAVEFLVLEEVGKEIDSKVSAPILEDLLRYREDNGLVTIVCTNLNISLMTERYGESCISLLKGNTTPVMIECEDKRATIFKKR
ncbi:MAG: DnaA protein [Bacteriophage sp.]|jgi:DNA replication protein DnaC|nr:MAG: DnaA protein [Bacteriophage sp.]DAH50373.1 MAG TPA: Replicative helicase [Caudoviricetes sp.]